MNTFQFATTNSPLQISDDELLIFINPLSQTLKNETYKTHQTKTIPSLSSKKHYLNVSAGFNPYPFLIVDWDRSQRINNLLEARWVSSHLCQLISSRPERKFVFFIGDTPTMEQLLIIEDIESKLANPRYTDSNIENIRIITHRTNFEKIDPFHEIRREHLLGFKGWINENPDELTSIEIGDRLKKFAHLHGCSFESMDRKALKKENMNLLLAVGQASELSPPRLHMVSYMPNKDEAPILLIGKGITFDTGGINVKPHLSYVNCMKNDMGGSALMSHLFMALVKSDIKRNIVLAIPTCENLVAERSMKPGSIITSRSGKEVIIEHTDAEGRLILVDAIHYCQERFQPNETIVAATLTTAVLRQFSNYYTAVHFAESSLENQIRTSASKWGELFTFWGHFLPFDNGNQTKAADLTNMGRLPSHANQSSGSNVAAHFLDDFSEGPLTHFDIFASCWNWSDDYPGAHYGATGAAFNSLFESFRENFGL